MFLCGLSVARAKVVEALRGAKLAYVERQTRKTPGVGPEFVRKVSRVGPTLLIAPRDFR